MAEHQAFAFLRQSYPVNGLIEAAVAALPLLPEQERAQLEQALRKFERFAVPTAWSPEDVNGKDLSIDEKAEVIDRYVKRYEATDAEWAAIEFFTEAVRTERKFIRTLTCTEHRQAA